MKKFLHYALSITLCALLFSGCGGEQGDNSRALKKIVIGVDSEFAPITFRDDKGEIVGFDVDMAKEAAKRLGVEFEFKPINWDKKEAEINSGRVDIIWSGCDITPERQQYMLFSKPYMKNRQILLVQKGNPKNIHSEGDLAGKIVATQAGTVSLDYIADNDALRDSLAKFITYRNVSEGFKALSNGAFDAFIVDEIAAHYEINKNPDVFEIIDVTIGSPTEFGVSFRKDNIKLCDEVQKVIDEMIADGTAEKISRKWFNADLVIRK